MAFGCGKSQEERFATARAAYVASHPKLKRPGKTMAGFLSALVRVPMVVFRTLAQGVRQQLEQQLVDAARIEGLLPIACDGTRLECPRSEQLQARLGQAGKADSAPMTYLTTLVLLPFGLPWSWTWGKGTASEHDHVRRLLPTLPHDSLLVGDCFFAGYELFRDILRARGSFLIRMSSRLCLYTLQNRPLETFREGIVYYWPEKMREKGKPPIKARLLRVRGEKADVWLLTSILDRQKLSHKSAAQIYRWRWRNEEVFRTYKRMLEKVKLKSRTIASVHREAEGSMLALQLLLAMAAQEKLSQSKPLQSKRSRKERSGKSKPQPSSLLESPRRILLRLRGELTALLRKLGPRQFAAYQQALEQVRSQPCRRTKPKARQAWPHKRKFKAPKPPKVLLMPKALRARLQSMLAAA
jgi:hypothetical protein